MNLRVLGEDEAVERAPTQRLDLGVGGAEDARPTTGGRHVDVVGLQSTLMPRSTGLCLRQNPLHRA